MAEINGNEVTTNGAVDTTKVDLETVKTVTLDEVAQVDAATIGSPAPVDLSDVTIAKKATTQTVTAPTVAAPADVAYTPVNGADDLTIEKLNQTAETLKASVNGELVNFTQRMVSALNSITSGTNTGFNNIKVQLDDQTDEVANKVGAVVDAVNVALEEVRVANKTQSGDIADKINLAVSQLTANINKVKSIADDSQAKIAQIDDVFLTDGDFMQRVEAMNALLETLRGADFDIVGAVSGSVAELNGLMRIRSKDIVISASTGKYPFNLVAEQLPELLDASYGVSLTVKDIGGNKYQPYHVDLSIGKGTLTKDGMDIVAMTKGATLIPQPIDASANAITVNVLITHNKLNPLTFDVDVLDDAWLTAGNGTDTVTVPAASAE
jgi:hypothetical protein